MQIYDERKTLILKMSLDVLNSVEIMFDELEHLCSKESDGQLWKETYSESMTASHLLGNVIDKVKTILDPNDMP